GVIDKLEFKAGGGKKLYTVKGQVVRGELGQPNLDVELLDAKKNVKGAAKTDKKGMFVIEGVEPGIYTVTSKVDALSFVGETKAFEVPAKDNKDINVTVSLFRK